MSVNLLQLKKKIAIDQVWNFFFFFFLGGVLLHLISLCCDGVVESVGEACRRMDGGGYNSVASVPTASHNFFFFNK